MSRPAVSNRAARPPSLTRRGVAVALVVAVSAVSTSAVLVRIAGAPSLALAFWRCALGAAVLAPFAVRAAPRAAQLTVAQRRGLVVSGLFLAAHFALFISSLSFTTVASSVVLVDMAPLFVGLGSARLLGEAPSQRTWRGIWAAVAGAVLIGAGDLSGAEVGGRALLGDVMAFGGAAMVAGYLIIGRSVRGRPLTGAPQLVPVSLYAAVVYGVAAVALLAVCVVAGTPLAGYPAGAWLAIAGLVIGPQLLGHTIFNTVLATVPAAVVAVAAVAEPIGAATLAWLVLGELPSPLFWLGAPLILAGVWLASTTGRQESP